MQKKFNIIIWTLIPFLFLFFMCLSIWNQGKLKRYSITWEQNGHTIGVTVFDQEKKNWNQKLREIRSEKVQASRVPEMFEILQEKCATDSYIIQIDEQVLVGTYYRKGKYQVATTDKTGNLFRIVELENQVLLTKEIEQQSEFDKIIVISSSLKKADALLTMLTDVSISDGKKLAREYDANVYWLKGHQEADFIQ